jgi:hypothetical protein
MRLLDFLSPTKFIILVLLLLVLFVPVFFVYIEPERTNYLPGEKPDYIVKTRLYPGTFQEYAFHTDGHIDLFWGVLGRNYVDNLIGPVLILVYYLFSSVLNWIYHRIRKQPDSSRNK